MKNFFKKTWTYKTFSSKKQSQKGMALLLAILTTVFIIYLVVEVSYETSIEYTVNAQSVNRLKAYYAAKSGVALSLLRIKLYMKAQQKYPNLPPEQKRLLDMIWNFPFMWPPMIPGEATAVEKDNVADTLKLSKMDAVYKIDIFDEGSKIDLNDLNSPSKKIRDATKGLLMTIYKSKVQNDEDWARENQDLPFEKAINSMIDWQDADDTSLNGGSEKQHYAALQTDLLPPNRAFRTVDEIRLVADMDETIYSLIKDQVTVFGTKAINPNYASSEVIQSLDPSITNEVVAEVLKRRTDDNPGMGPFKDAPDFWNFVNSKGGRVSDEAQAEIPLSFESVYTFKIVSLGEFAGATRQIEAIVFDLNHSAKTLADQVKKEAASGTSTSSTTTTTTTMPGGGPGTAGPVSQQALPKGPPRIVHWREL